MFTLSPAARLRALLSRARLVRMFGMGVTMQALLSGANLIVGLILIRRASDLQYSYYILATGALLLATSLQASFMQPYLVTQITRAELPEHRAGPAHQRIAGGCGAGTRARVLPHDPVRLPPAARGAARRPGVRR